jgi:ketosteroid isomerase-like protein
MYHRIVRRQVKRSFDALNQHDYRPVVENFHPQITHSFAGEHALGGTRHSRSMAQQWYERLFRLFPDMRFDVQNIIIAGLPHDTRIAIEFHVALTPPNGGHYTNTVAQFIRLRWGRIIEVHLHEDTEKLVRLLGVLSAHGISEASAPPIAGR